MEEQARKAERIKALLSGYYGSAGPPKANQGQGAKGEDAQHREGGKGVQQTSSASSLEAASQEARRWDALLKRIRLQIC
eukprot:1158181-Pelagomonas_calceolata.AAC.1